MSTDLTPAEQVRRAGFAVNPPASEVALQEVETAWGVELPEELRALYLDHDGQPLSVAGGERWQPFKLLSAEDLAAKDNFLEWYETELEQGEAGESPEDYADIFSAFLPCWFDGHDNYAVYYLAGPLRGMVGEMSHEVPWAITPTWRSLRSFYCAMTSAEAATFTYATNFPAAESEDAQQAAAFAYARDQFARDVRPPAREFWGTAMLALCPAARSEELAPLLQPLSGGDVSECVCYMIPQTAKAMLERQGAAAIPHLLTMLERDAVEQSMSECAYVYTEVLQLLGTHPSAEAEAALRQLAQHTQLAGARTRFSHALATALMARGYQRERRHDGTVRLSKEGAEALELPRA